MRITNHIYKTSGIEYGTNSNTYAIATSKELVLIDVGFQDFQWDRMMQTIKFWKLDHLPITHVFITHNHFDHCGNVWRANELGAKVISSSDDSDKIINGNLEMEQLFGAEWVCGAVDEQAKDGDVYNFADNTQVKVLETPGHTKGCLSFLVETDGAKALFSGDIFFIAPAAPKDDVVVELGYMGSADFDFDDYLASLEQLKNTPATILLPGHYHCYFGNVRRVCRMAYDAANQLQKFTVNVDRKVE